MPVWPRFKFFDRFREGDDAAFAPDRLERRDQELEDWLDWHCYDIPAGHVNRTAVQSIANNTVTAYAFDSERYNLPTRQPMHSTTTNNSRATITRPGIYHFGGTASFAANAAGTRLLYLVHNATTAMSQHQFNAGGVLETHNLHVSADWYCAAGDYVELWCYQFSGGALNSTPEMWWHLVRDHVQ